jgi:hypothetical protein
MSTTHKLPSEYRTASFRHASTKERLALLEAEEDAFVARQRDLEFLAQLTAAYMAAAYYLQEEASS